MNNAISIYGQSVNPGERKTIQLPMPKLYDWTPMTMPVHVLHGKQSGPVLCITSAIHGDEIIGIEVIRRLLKKTLLKKLIGTIIAVPIVNVYGFLYQNRYLMDRRDLNRSFPGSKSGSLAARLADLVTSELITHATHCIDLHTGSLHRSNLPHIRADLSFPGIKPLAKAFNVPVILHSEMRDGSLREYADNQGIPFLLFEAGESLRFDELSIRSGVNGILNIMHKLKMVTLKKQPLKALSPSFAYSSFWIRAPISGVLGPHKPLGKKVKTGDTIAIIANPAGTHEYKLKSPDSGIIIGKSNLPLVHEGAALFHVASVKKPSDVADQIETLQEYYG